MSEQYMKASANHRIAIVAHHDRMERAGDLAEKVGAEYVFVDTGDFGSRANHYRAWEELSAEEPQMQWSVILEDDALPVIGFNHQLEMALDVAPADIVSFYLGRVRPKFVQHRIAAVIDTPSSWIVGDWLYHHVAVAIRTHLVPNMLKYVAPIMDKMPFDEAVAAWARRHTLDIVYSNPSLVDHDDSLPSLATTHLPEGGRRAWRVGVRKHWGETSTFL